LGSSRGSGRAGDGAQRAGGSLSDREIEILQAIADGKPTSEMAEALEITENTVRSHVKNILSKLDVHSKAEAVMKGVRLGLIETVPRD
jgi:DNA-binding CsgD family transcriptional regulator